MRRWSKAESSGVRWHQRLESNPKAARTVEPSLLLPRTGPDVTRQLHSPNRFQGPAQSADSFSSVRRREVWLSFLSYQLDRRLRADLPDARVGSDRTKTVVIAFNGSGTAKVP